MRSREGDLIRTGDNVIFDVKGLVHPPRKVIAFPRYIPDPAGLRGHVGIAYSKVYNLAERFIYLQKAASQLIVDDPVFGERLCEVPTSIITKRYDPIQTLETLRKEKTLQPLEQKAVELAEELHAAAGIPWTSMGVSGSIMAGLFTSQSDIDPLVYGSDNSRKAYQALQVLLGDEESKFKPYNPKEMRALFDFRSKDTIMSFEDFELVESRKAFQGKFEGTDYFVRFVKSWNEVSERYGDVVYSSAGRAKIFASVVDDAEALFTPCTYKIADVRVLEGQKLESIIEVTSFRGRFCEQAKIGEGITVQGKVELVTDKQSGRVHHRIIIGNQPADYMIISRR
jgi:predicted nucleotidyltransferase